MLRFCFLAITVLLLSACTAPQEQAPANSWKAVTLSPGESAATPHETEAEEGAVTKCARKTSLTELWSSCVAPQ